MKSLPEFGHRGSSPAWMRSSPASSRQAESHSLPLEGQVLARISTGESREVTTEQPSKDLPPASAAPMPWRIRHVPCRLAQARAYYGLVQRMMHSIESPDGSLNKQGHDEDVRVAETGCQGKGSSRRVCRRLTLGKIETSQTPLLSTQVDEASTAFSPRFSLQSLEKGSDDRAGCPELLRLSLSARFVGRASRRHCRTSTATSASSRYSTVPGTIGVYSLGPFYSDKTLIVTCWSPPSCVTLLVVS